MGGGGGCAEAGEDGVIETSSGAEVDGAACELGLRRSFCRCLPHLAVGCEEDFLGRRRWMSLWVELRRASTRVSKRIHSSVERSLLHYCWISRV